MGDPRPQCSLNYTLAYIILIFICWNNITWQLRLIVLRHGQGTRLDSYFSIFTWMYCFNTTPYCHKNTIQRHSQLLVSRLSKVPPLVRFTFFVYICCLSTTSYFHRDIIPRHSRLLAPHLGQYIIPNSYSHNLLSLDIFTTLTSLFIITATPFRDTHDCYYYVPLTWRTIFQY